MPCPISLAETPAPLIRRIQSEFVFSADSGDKPYPTDRPAYVVWAMGRLDHRKEPSFHDYYLKSDLLLELNKKEPGDWHQT